MPPPRSPIDWSAPLSRILHATAIALDGKGALLVGPSGSGKSSLALDLMSRGAKLVSDDLVQIRSDPAGPLLSAPPQTDPVPAIEARGLGLLGAELAGPVPLFAIVDLGMAATDRLPPSQEVEIEGHAVPLLPRVDTPVFAAMLVQFLRGGWYRA